jgi:predicted DsbA family dithiol-disulfide isomerase
LIDQAVAAVPGLDRSQLERDRHGDWAGAQIRAASSAAEAAGIVGTPSFEIGPTGGTMTRVSLSSIGPEGLRPAIEALLAG